MPSNLDSIKIDSDTDTVNNLEEVGWSTEINEDKNIPACKLVSTHTLLTHHQGLAFKENVLQRFRLKEPSHTHRVGGQLSISGC